MTNTNTQPINNNQNSNAGSQSGFQGNQNLGQTGNSTNFGSTQPPRDLALAKLANKAARSTKMTVSKTVNVATGGQAGSFYKGGAGGYNPTNPTVNLSSFNGNAIVNDASTASPKVSKLAEIQHFLDDVVRIMAKTDISLLDETTRNKVKNDCLKIFWEYILNYLTMKYGKKEAIRVKVAAFSNDSSMFEKFENLDDEIAEACQSFVKDVLTKIK